ncbi:MAG TPA: hypothetical protein DCG47_13595 [Spirochaetaceae bacterium]|nr:hypothetical protein [Spirochaetaceae bacterium]
MTDISLAGVHAIMLGKERAAPLAARCQELEFIEEKTAFEKAELSANRLAIIMLRLDVLEEAVMEVSREMYAQIDAPALDQAIDDALLARHGLTAALEAIDGFARRLRALENERGIK